MKFISKTILATLFFVFYCSVTCAEVPEKQDYLVLSAGSYDVLSEDERTFEGRIEFKKDIDFFIKPLVGGLITGKRAVYGYVGIYHDFFWHQLFITPSFAAGLYERGNGKDLNYPIEFKSQIEIGYEFDNHYRLSGGFSHISNASLSDTRGESNPGAESAFISFHMPFDYFK